MPVPISATSMPHISAPLSCLSMSFIQCHPSVPFNATYQCQVSAAYQCQSVPPISAMPISATSQCPSVQPISAHHCSLISAHQ
ncbi:unnamed protein product [Staurois parvus]|uniref:Uncharacterized protein n=1 Tax=Staurois parvus TaxID=386267 RepID=A0ABN9EN38_9NEOB|nr:unnamed protein product [Staurois parvus]